MWRCQVFLCLMLAVLSIAACHKESEKLPVPPPGLFGNQTQIMIGQRLFKAHCAECHGSVGEGRTQRAARLIPIPPDFRERRYRTLLPGYLYRRIEQGRNVEPYRSSGSVMPAWGPYMNPEQIWSLVAFIRDRSGATQ